MRGKQMLVVLDGYAVVLSMPGFAQEGGVCSI
jgi:hypothetical protein